MLVACGGLSSVFRAGAEPGRCYEGFGCCTEDQVERWLEDGFELVLAVVVVGDLNLFEDELIEHAADLFGRPPVAGPDELGEVQCLRDESVSPCAVSGEISELPRDGQQLSIESLLLGTEHVERDRVVVVGFEELLLFALDLLLRGLKMLVLGDGIRADVRE
ncbi:hypothetical protein [Leucobacter sp. 1207-22]|uniref:hypothetical protein n=1 Tax=Leucobacter sp. 1207-22 TaxID=2604456 RepID=UPI004063CC11